MYKIQLVKGLSYHGIVTATKDSPIVEVETKEEADSLVSGGHFVMLETAAENGGEAKTDLGKMTKDELIAYAADKGIEINADGKKADILSAIKEAETAAENGGEADYGEE